MLQQNSLLLSFFFLRDLSHILLQPKNLKITLNLFFEPDSHVLLLAAFDDNSVGGVYNGNSRSRRKM